MPKQRKGTVFEAFEGNKHLSCCCHGAVVKTTAVYPIPRLSPRCSAGALFVCGPAPSIRATRGRPQIPASLDGRSLALARLARRGLDANQMPMHGPATNGATAANVPPADRHRGDMAPELWCHRRAFDHLRMADAMVGHECHSKFGRCLTRITFVHR
jgi:hypothetical protein